MSEELGYTTFIDTTEHLELQASRQCLYDSRDTVRHLTAIFTSLLSREAYSTPDFLLLAGSVNGRRSRPQSITTTVDWFTDRDLLAALLPDIE